MALLENASSAVGDGVPRGEEVAVDMTPVAEEVLDLLRFHVRHALYKVRPPALSIAAPNVLSTNTGLRKSSIVAPGAFDDTALPALRAGDTRRWA